MQLELDIPEKLIRKLKALTILEGETPDSIEEIVMASLEHTVEERIRSHLSSTPDYVERKQKIVRPAEASVRRAAVSRMETDDTGMSDGLGDFDEYMPDAESDEETFVPKKGGVSNKDLDEDMDVEDPEHEAKAEAAEFPPDTDPNEIFASMVGIPMPAPDGLDTDARIARRKRKLKIKGRVSGVTDANINDLL